MANVLASYRYEGSKCILQVFSKIGPVVRRCITFQVSTLESNMTEEPPFSLLYLLINVSLETKIIIIVLISSIISTSLGHVLSYRNICAYHLHVMSLNNNYEYIVSIHSEHFFKLFEIEDLWQTIVKQKISWFPGHLCRRVLFQQ